MDSFLKWIGGKKALRNQIIGLFPKDIERYIEVFGGAGWVLFGAETRHAKMEVFNDLDSQLINLYRCIKYHRPELERELQYIIHSRKIFMDFKLQLSYDCLTDIQRAAKYFVLVRSSFGADRRSFATSINDISRKIDTFPEVQMRLGRVIIECRDFEKLIATYDRENALFYLDPPYVNAEQFYDNQFTTEDHIRLFNALRKIKGKFLLSYNNSDFIADMYKDYNIIPVMRQNSLSTGTYSELIIKNY